MLLYSIRDMHFSIYVCVCSFVYIGAYVYMQICVYFVYIYLLKRLFGQSFERHKSAN